MPDNHAYPAQDAQEITNNIQLKRALDCLSVPMEFAYNVAIKLQAAGLLDEIPGDGVQLIKWLDGAGAREMLDAAEESQKRAEQLKAETEETPHIDPEDPNKNLVPWLTKIREWQALQNLARLTYYAVYMRVQIVPKITDILSLLKPETMDVAEKGIEILEQMLSTTVVNGEGLMPAIVEELEDPKYWNVPEADLFSPATVDNYCGTWWAFAVSEAARKAQEEEKEQEPAVSLAATDPEIEKALQISRIPQEMAFPKDKVTRVMSEGKLLPDPDGYKIDMGSDKGKYFSTVEISLDALPSGVEITREFTSFDDSVFRAICSIIDGGASVFTGDDIYRTMTGNIGCNPTPEQLQAIYESWIRLTTTVMTLDTGNVGTPYKFERWRQMGHVVEGTTGEHIVGNQHGITSTRYYKVSAKPMLVNFANLLDQVARYPLFIANTPVSKNPEMMALQNALLDRIIALTSSKKMSNVILYEYILSHAGLKDVPKAKMARIRGYIAKMLDYWVQVGLLSKWEEVKKGRSFVAVKVQVKSIPKAISGGQS